MSCMCSCCSEECIRGESSPMVVMQEVCEYTCGCMCEVIVLVLQFASMSACFMLVAMFTGLQILFKLCQLGSNSQFWAMKLYG